MKQISRLLTQWLKSLNLLKLEKWESKQHGYNTFNLEYWKHLKKFENRNSLVVQWLEL